MMRRAIAALALTATLPVHAQSTLPYEVLPGDSLYSIAERHLEDARQWPELARVNRIARPSRLVPGQRLQLPVSMLKGTATQARVEYARGTVLADGMTLRIGDVVGEGTVLEVHAQGFVRSEEVQRPFAIQREAWYAQIDWAIDISRARFKEFDVRGIPARLFRRDPESQVVVTRDRALRAASQGLLDPTMKLWPFMLKLFLADGDNDMILVAPMGAPAPRRNELLSGLRELRRLGVAEPD